MISEKTLKTLEFDKMLAIASAFCVSQAGLDEFLRIRPEQTFKGAVYSLALTSEALEISSQGLNPIQNFDKLTDILLRTKVGSCLSIADMQKVLRLLKASDRLKNSIRELNSFKTPAIKKMTEAIVLFPEFMNELERALLNDNELSDLASPALGSIRARIAFQKNRLKQKLNSIVKSADSAKILQDGIYTVRNGRYVLPVKAEHKGSIDGFLHDASQTGSTLFIEPIEVLKENNALKNALLEEQEEIARLLEEYTYKTAEIVNELESNQSILINCDIVFAKAHYGASIKGQKPELGLDGGFNFPLARHPLIEADRVVAVDLNIDDKNILLISGPNTGGKTVALKTAGLLCLMSFCGFFIPAGEGCCLKYFNKVFCDIGDEQSIQGNLSTFSSHIKNIISILNHADSQTLVLLDELGAGTDPSEGAALGIAILNKLLLLGAKTVATTHYSELKEFGLKSNRVMNASMEFDPKTFLPTFKLKTGLPGVSNAIAISRHLGLDEKIVKDALDYLGEGRRTFEEVLIIADRARTALEDEKKELEKRKEDAEKKLNQIEELRKNIDAEYQKIKNTARQKTDKIIERTKDEAETILQNMRELEKEVNTHNLMQAKHLYASIDTSFESDNESFEMEYVPLERDEAKTGRTVIVRSLGVQGVIKSPPNAKNEVDLMVGNMPVKLKLDMLAKERFERKKEGDIKKPKTTLGVLKHQSAVTEINLLGKTVDEAVIEVDAFLDTALMSGLQNLKIIHGIGTGALRKGLHKYLKGHKAVGEFRQGVYGEGGAGVTILTLKT